MNNKKMIVTDLDGTLLKIDKSITDNSIEYLSKLKEQGYIIVIATGRILASAINVTKQAKFANYIISDNGSIIYNVETKKIIFESYLDADKVKEICSYYNKYENEIDYIDVCDINHYKKYTNKKYDDFDFSITIENKEDYMSYSNNVTHISLMFSSDELIDKISEELNSSVLDLNYTIMRDSFSKVKCIEISNKNISKYSAIKKVSEIENISNENITAFGDGLNDIDMLTNCGVGVAMGNALEEVKKVANHITISHNDEGVIHYLIENEIGE